MPRQAISKVKGRDHKRRKIGQRADAKALENDIRSAAEQAVSDLRLRLGQSDALDLLRAVKFERMGRDPLDPNRQINSNLMEQVNQTFTALVSVRAVEYLFDHHPEAAPFRLNLGTAPGSDIESLDGSVAAEVFAATYPNSNNKLKKDIQKVKEKEDTAKHLYVFFHCPGDHASYWDDNVRVIPLGLERQPNEDRTSEE